MKRTQIYFSENIPKKLEQLSQRKGSSKSEIIREAVEKYLQSESISAQKDKLKAGKGLRKNKSDFPDFAQLRREFDRIP